MGILEAIVGFAVANPELVGVVLGALGLGKYFRKSRAEKLLDVADKVFDWVERAGKRWTSEKKSDYFWRAYKRKLNAMGIKKYSSRERERIARFVESKAEVTPHRKE